MTSTTGQLSRAINIAMILSGFLLFIVSSGAVFAHVEGNPEIGLLFGALHPLGGSDHLFAMLTIGLLAANYGDRALWGLPLAAAAGIVGGAMLSTVTLPSSLIEVSVVGSLIMLGVMLFRGREQTIGSGFGIVAFLALLHGYTHAVQMPTAIEGWQYGAGFIGASLLLQLIGIAIGFLLQWLFPVALRALGLMIAAVSFYFGLLLFG